uniref:Uncharacterized protein n=1 Tax=Arundo donax TaxID=35708 RepID=A0A0A9FR28_ARUDO
MPSSPSQHSLCFFLVPVKTVSLFVEVLNLSQLRCTGMMFLDHDEVELSIVTRLVII